VTLSPDKCLVTATNEAVKVWDIDKGTELLTLKGHKSAVLCVAFSPEGRYIATGANDQTAKVWNARSGEELFCFTEHKGAVRCLAFSPDSNRIVSASDDKTARIWRIQVRDR